jgi:hypothetical protein
MFPNILLSSIVHHRQSNGNFVVALAGTGAGRFGELASSHVPANLDLDHFRLPVSQRRFLGLVGLSNYPINPPRQDFLPTFHLRFHRPGFDPKLSLQSTEETSKTVC